MSFRRPLPKRQYLALAIASILALLAVWALVAHLRVFPVDYFPGPGKVASAAFRLFVTQGLGIDLLASTGRILTAFAASALLALPLGLAMSCFKSVEAWVEPLVDFVRYVPVPALLPIFVLMAGIGEAPKFLVLFFGTFFQLVLLVLDDADDVPSVYFDLARTLGAGEAALIRHVLVPHLLPRIYDRLRVTLGWCWTYLVIAELVAVERGIGHAIKEAQRFNATADLFVSCIVLGLIGLGTDYAAKLGYRRLFPYAAKSALQGS